MVRPVPRVMFSTALAGPSHSRTSPSARGTENPTSNKGRIKSSSRSRTKSFMPLDVFDVQLAARFLVFSGTQCSGRTSDFTKFLGVFERIESKVLDTAISIFTIFDTSRNDANARCYSSITRRLI
jgi:hypothetical protein